MKQILKQSLLPQHLRVTPTLVASSGSSLVVPGSSLPSSGISLSSSGSTSRVPTEISSSKAVSSPFLVPSIPRKIDSLITLDQFEGSTSPDASNDKIKNETKKIKRIHEPLSVKTFESSVFQRLREYVEYKIKFPQLIPSDKKKLITKIEEILGYDEFKDMKIMELNLDDCIDNTPTLNAFSITSGVSLKFLYPPVNTCKFCFRNLHANHTWNFSTKGPTQVKVHTTKGTEVYSKLIYRCKKCPQFHHQDVTYHIDKFGNDTKGWRFFEKCNFIRASEVVFYEKVLIEGFLTDNHHCQTSIVGKSESFNEQFRTSEATEFCRKFVSNNQEQCEAFEEKSEDDDDEKPLKNVSCKQFSKTFFWEANRHSLSSAIWLKLALEEATECQILETEFFGPKVDEAGRRITLKQSLHEFRDRTNNMRAGQIFEHKMCTTACKERGCGTLTVVDGLWKICYPLCMYSQLHDKDSFMPNVCVEAPLPGKAFCEKHGKLLELHNVPTGLQEFLRYCGGDPDNNDSESSLKKLVDKKISEINRWTKGKDNSCVPVAQGTQMFFDNEEMMKDDLLTIDDENKEECSKNVGKRKRRQRWLKGVLFAIGGGGIIQQASPLYNSESPTQVAFIMIGLLMKLLEDVNPDDWGSYVIAYDNMCNVDRLKLLKKPLPVEAKFSDVWLKVTKIIDRLHLKNHKRPECHIKYNPNTDELKNMNTMICEQTFSWLSRFKKTLNSLPKTKFIFFLDQLITRRNR